MNDSSKWLVPRSHALLTPPSLMRFESRSALDSMVVPLLVVVLDRVRRGVCCR